ncbi:MAG: DUF6114 domain-containing protein [Thermoplasmataceae archaeon]
MPRVEKSILDSSLVSLVAGLVVLSVGVYLVFLGFYYFGLIGIGWGAGIIVSSVLLLFYPGKHMILGTIIILLSLGSWYGTSGGLIAGSIIGIIGGFMTIIWNKRETGPARSNSTSKQ